MRVGFVSTYIKYGNTVYNICYLVVIKIYFIKYIKQFLIELLTKS